MQNYFICRESPFRTKAAGHTAEKTLIRFQKNPFYFLLTKKEENKKTGPDGKVRNRGRQSSEVQHNRMWIRRSETGSLLHPEEIELRKVAFCLPKPDSSGNKTCVLLKSKLLFAEKTGTFAPKDVSISGKRLLLFRISLNVFPNCIYCSGKRSFRTLFSLWLLSAKRRDRTIGRTSI